MSDVEKDTAGFEHTGDINDIPVKGDVKTSRIIADETDKIGAEKIRDAVRTAAGETPKGKKEPVGTLTKDAPQMVFRVVGGFIGCKKFELDDKDAEIYATHLNILFPVSGKLVSLIVLVMITLNKVYICMDAIQAKFGKKDDVLKQETPSSEEPL